MCDSIRFHSSPNPPCQLNPPPRILSHFCSHPSSCSTWNQPFHNPQTGFSPKLQLRALTASISNGPDSSAEIAPVSVALSPISAESEFDQVVSDGPAVIMWTASWCRKCIYLKPKMEKLAAEYLHRVRFYCVDVNKVPHKLVARASVTKMPTVQLWIDGKKQDEVVGGDKPHLVVNEVRLMIDNDIEI